MRTTYKKLDWNSYPFCNFDLYIHNSPGDGHCMIHSIAFAYYSEYRSGMVGNVAKSREKIVVDIRHLLAEKLEKIYDTIYGGAYKELGQHVPFYTMENLQKHFRSKNSLGEEMLSIIEEILDKNIFLLDSVKKDIHVTTSLIKDRKSIILYYSYDPNNLDAPGHFDTVALFHNGVNLTHFDFKDSFIQCLVSVIEKKKKEK